MIREGFWSEANPPVPHAAAWEGQEGFLQALSVVEGAAKIVQYRGLSTCRVCCRANGSREFSTSSAVWPSGFRHYVEAHNVRPSREFQDHIAAAARLRTKEPRVSDWQPVETVPKDGSFVTGGWFAWDDARPPLEHVEYHLKWDKKAGGLTRAHLGGRVFLPTHWKPEKAKR